MSLIVVLFLYFLKLASTELATRPNVGRSGFSGFGNCLSSSRAFGERGASRSEPFFVFSRRQVLLLKNHSGKSNG